MFPETTRFRVTLKGMENRKNIRAINLLAKFLLIPFSVGIVNSIIGRTIGRRTMGEGIFSITTEDAVVESGRKSKEATLDSLFDTR